MVSLGVDKPQILPIVEKSLGYRVNDTYWIPKSKRIVTIGEHAKGTGALEVFTLKQKERNQWDLEKSNSITCDVSLSTATFDASPMSDRRLAVADYAGKITLHDLDRSAKNSSTWEATHNKSKKTIIKALVGCGGMNIGAGPNELASGAEDGIVKLWDLRQPGEAVIELAPAKHSDSEAAVNAANIPAIKNTPSRSCWSLAFGNSYNEHERALVCGYDNGDIKMFDLRNRSLYWDENVKNGIVDIEFDRRDNQMNKLAAVTLEGNVHCWDTRKLSDKNKEFARVTEIPHTSTAWRCRHLPQNRDVFMSTSGNGHCYLWKYNYPEKRVNEEGTAGVPGELEMLQKFPLSTQPITGLDWNRDLMGLGVASSLDESVRTFITSRLNTL